MSTGTQLQAETPRCEPLSLIPIDALEGSASNPRKAILREELEELARSIATIGVLQPLTVRPLQTSANRRYEIVIGERRWRAAKLANLTHVPCLVRTMTDVAALEAQIVENLQRRDIAPLEEAASYQALLKATNNGATEKIGVADIAARIGKSPRYVYDRLELLKLSEPAKRELSEGKINAGHAAEIARLKPELQLQALAAVSEQQLSVMALRRWVGNGGCPRPEQPGHGLQTSAKPRSIPAADSCEKSYSADLIPSGRIRAPYLHAGILWCCTEISGDNCEAFRVLERSKFAGKPVTYAHRSIGRNAEKARSDPRGFYHGVIVKWGSQSFVLAGPPAVFRTKPERPAAPKELSRNTLERAIRTTLHRVIGDLRLARLTPARKRGEWHAVIVQSRRGEHGKSGTS